MKISTFIDNVKLLFHQWELGYSIMFSITLQAFLIFWTYKRRNSVGTMKKTLWLGVFLAADFVATLCLGAIFHLPLGPSGSSSSSDHNKKIKNFLVIWSPFILLHLGRHGTLIGISLADNEFWPSHFFKFLYYEFTALTISILGSSTRWFNLASRIMLVGGSLKFAERVLAHKKESMNELRRSIFKEDDHGGRGILEINRMIEYIPVPNRRGDLEESYHAVDINIVGEENDDLGDDANNEVDVPLVASEDENVIALCEAYHAFNKHKDLYVEGRSFEDCYRIRGGHWRGENFNLGDAGTAFNNIKMELSFAYDHSYTKNGIIAYLVGLDCPIFFLESGSLLESILSKRFLVQIGIREGATWRRLEGVIVKLTGYFDLKQFWNNINYISRISIEDVHDHWPDEESRFLNLVFDCIGERLRRERMEDDRFRFQSPISTAVRGQLPDHIFETTDFEECVIVWHLATDVCYRLYSNFEESHYLQYAKYLSDYMLYLLQAHPEILSPLTRKELQGYRNACAAINRFYVEMGIQSQMITDIFHNIEPTYDILRQIPREERPRNISNLLLDGYELAREIGRQRIQEYRVANEAENIWRVLFEVWVDILSYTAIHVPGKQHAEHLVTGGEFIT
ncbi:hypothetical protein RND71_022225 [Anisodus tanguticus]|uniref:DUF4220 domain-containing protein n=1 Tax=Anisodus tanguticus TaxID=243964 RepID=A0AAE1VDT7_9SOLA|nr:hypothetical protein RND71_022225 [Anisodus tanguticus]